MKKKQENVEKEVKPDQKYEKHCYKNCSKLLKIRWKIYKNKIKIEKIEQIQWKKHRKKLKTDQKLLTQYRKIGENWPKVVKNLT